MIFPISELKRYLTELAKKIWDQNFHIDKPVYHSLSKLYLISFKPLCDELWNRQIPSASFLRIIISHVHDCQEWPANCACSIKDRSHETCQERSHEYVGLLWKAVAHTSSLCFCLHTKPWEALLMRISVRMNDICTDGPHNLMQEETPLIRVTK